MDLVSVRKTVSRIRANLFKNSNSYSIGMLRSHFKGTGLQFKEHQIYTYGDDIRFIDWKLLAKTRVPFIKTFEEERNVEIVVVLDTSPSMYNGFKNVSKLQASIEICCLIYLLAKETGDFVHALVIGNEVINIPKKSGEEGIAFLISSLERHGILDEKGRVNLNYTAKSKVENKKAMGSILEHIGKRREIVLLSDFNDFIEMDDLKRMLFKSHVHCFQLQSPLDEMDSVPYAIYSHDPSGKSKGKLIKANILGKNEDLYRLGKRFKKLKVHDRYLEGFIKEML